MSNLCVLIVNYQSLTSCLRLIKTLLNLRLPAKLQLSFVVINNDSPQLEFSHLAATRANFTLIQNSRNLGFAAAVNQGLKLALAQHSDHVLVLNPDTTIDLHTFPRFLTNPADLVGPILKYRQGRVWRYDLGGYINYRLGQTRHLEVSKLPSEHSQSPDYLSGCCLKISRHALTKIGYFDDRYFLYFEDVDYCLRAAGQGIFPILDYSTVVYHHLKPTSQKSISQNTYLVHSNFRFIRQYLRPYHQPLALGFLGLRYLKILLKW